MRRRHRSLGGQPTTVGVTRRRREGAVGDPDLVHHVGLAREQDAARTYVVVRLDDQVGEAARGPQEGRHDDESDGVGHEDGHADVARRTIHPPIGELPQRQQQDHDGRHAEDDLDEVQARLGLQILVAHLDAGEHRPGSRRSLVRRAALVLVRMLSFHRSPPFSAFSYPAMHFLCSPAGASAKRPRPARCRTIGQRPAYIRGEACDPPCHLVGRERTASGDRVGAAAESVFTFLFKYPPRLFQRGEIVLAPVVSAPLLAIALLVAITLVALTYRRVHGVSRMNRALLGGWRALSIAIVLGCLLRPMLVLSTALAQRNVLAVLLDDSRSMRLADVDGATRLSAMQRTFGDSSALLRGLSQRFAVRVFRFAADATPVAGASTLTASGGRTDLAAALDAVRDELAGMPLAGIVVATDGADNGGSDLTAAMRAVESRRVPVHTVGIGQERFTRDLAVAEVAVPTSVLAGSTVLLDAVIGVRGAAGERAMVSVEANGRIVSSDEVRIPDRGDMVRTRLRVPPLPPGTYQLSVRVRPIAGEQVQDNNVLHSMLEVRSGPARILYLEGEPRPEFAFLGRAIAADSALQMVGLVRTAEHKFLRLGVRDSLELLGGFPTRREELFQFRAIVLGSIESSYFTGEQLRMLSDFVSRRGGTLLALGGTPRSPKADSPRRRWPTRCRSR